MDFTNLTSGEQFAIWRRRNSVKQTELAKFIKVHPTTISKMERGTLWNEDYANKYIEFIKDYEEKKKVV